MVPSSSTLTHILPYSQHQGP